MGSEAFVLVLIPWPGQQDMGQAGIGSEHCGAHQEPPQAVLRALVSGNAAGGVLSRLEAVTVPCAAEGSAARGWVLAPHLHSSVCALLPGLLPAGA